MLTENVMIEHNNTMSGEKEHFLVSMGLIYPFIEPASTGTVLNAQFSMKYKQ